MRFFNFVNLKNIDNTILICNHQSYVDPILISIPLPYLPIFIARRTLLENVVFGNILTMFDDLVFIPRDNFSAETFKIVVSQLKNTGKAVLIYPEGTRGLNNKVQEFKRGFAVIANILHRDINLFYIRNSHFVLGKFFMLANLFTPISVYYLQKISYNTSSSLLYRKVNGYYREFERRSG